MADFAASSRMLVVLREIGREKYGDGRCRARGAVRCDGRARAEAVRLCTVVHHRRQGVMGGLYRCLKAARRIEGRLAS